MKIKKMDSRAKFYYDGYKKDKKDKKAFSNWMANNIKNDIRIVDKNDCREAWNAAIYASIRMVNRSNQYLIYNLQKLIEK